MKTQKSKEGGTPRTQRNKDTISQNDNSDTNGTTQGVMTRSQRKHLFLPDAGNDASETPCNLKRTRKRLTSSENSPKTLSKSMVKMKKSASVNTNVDEDISDVNLKQNTKRHNSSKSPRSSKGNKPKGETDTEDKNEVDIADHSAECIPSTFEIKGNDAAENLKNETKQNRSLKKCKDHCAESSSDIEYSPSKKKKKNDNQEKSMLVKNSGKTPVGEQCENVKEKSCKSTKGKSDQNRSSVVKVSSPVLENKALESPEKTSKMSNAAVVTSVHHKKKKKVDHSEIKSPQNSHEELKTVKQNKIPSSSPKGKMNYDEKPVSTEKHKQKKMKMSPKNQNFSTVTEKQVSSDEAAKLPNTSKQSSFSSASKKKLKQDTRSESSDSDSDAESRKAIKESAHKRIIQNLSTSESESKKFIRPVRKYSEELSDSDSAPETMSFSAGRQMEVDSLKKAMESINREKQRKKEKRKERLEKYKQQKEEKLIRLKEKRASQEDASCSSSEESGYEEDELAGNLGRSYKKQKIKSEKENVDDPSRAKVKKLNFSEDEIEPKDRKEKRRKCEQKETQQLVGSLRMLPSDILESLPDQIPVKVSKFENEVLAKDKRRHNKQNHVKEKRQDFRNRSDVDYIPLNTGGSTEFGVMPLDTFSRAPKSMAEQAAEFRQKMLFGPHIKRGPANAHIIYQQKLKAAGKGRYRR